MTNSPTNSSSTLSNAPSSTQDGAQPITLGKAAPTDVTGTAEIIEQLGRLLDIIHNWPIKAEGGKMPTPFMDDGLVFFVFPTGRHVIKNTVTSEGKMNFSVDDVTVIAEKKSEESHE